MKFFTKLTSALLVMAGSVLGVWFYLDNLESLTVVFFGASIEGLPRGLWLLVFFVIGALLGLSVSAVQSVRHQMHLQILRRQLKALKQKTMSRTA